MSVTKPRRINACSRSLSMWVLSRCRMLENQPVFIKPMFIRYTKRKNTAMLRPFWFGLVFKTIETGSITDIITWQYSRFKMECLAGMREPLVPRDQIVFASQAGCFFWCYVFSVSHANQSAISICTILSSILTGNVSISS